jgi:hypothetical protein
MNKSVHHVFRAGNLERDSLFDISVASRREEVPT